MKKIRKVEEYYCDYCGEKCTHTKFVIPERINSSVQIAGIKTSFEENYCTTKDICPKCQEKIIMLMIMLPKMRVRDDSASFEIVWGDGK